MAFCEWDRSSLFSDSFEGGEYRFDFLKERLSSLLGPRNFTMVLAHDDFL